MMSIPPIMTEGVEYWNMIAGQWRRKKSYSLWLVYCDKVMSGFFRSQLPEKRVEFLLKTDLFEEAFGNGLQPMLASKARRVVGMDIAIQTVEQAHGKYAMIHPIAANVQALPFQDASFDLIVSNSTIDHFSRKKCIRLCLDEFYRILRPGGRLLLTMDNLMNPLVGLRQRLTFPVLNRLKITPYFFGVTCGPVQLDAMLRSCGFKPGSVTGILHCPRVAAVPICRVLVRYGSVAMQQRFLRALLLLERLFFYPIGMISGHFIAVRAEKPAL